MTAYESISCELYIIQAIISGIYLDLLIWRFTNTNQDGIIFTKSEVCESWTLLIS